MTRLLLIIILTSIISCNKGYNTKIYSQNILPIKSVQTYSDGQVYGGQFEYIGDKLFKSIDINNKNYALYFYTADLITKIEQYDSKKKLIGTLTFEYDTKKRLVREILGDGVEANYFFNSDNSIYAVINYDTLTIFTENNKVIKEVHATGDIYTYQHDTYHSPLKNIIGMDKLFYSYEFGNAGTYYNITSKKQQNSNHPFIAESKFNYNDQNYPIRESYIQKDEQNKIIDQYTIAYQYNK